MSTALMKKVSSMLRSKLFLESSRVWTPVSPLVPEGGEGGWRTVRWARGGHTKGVCMYMYMYMTVGGAPTCVCPV